MGARGAHRPNASFSSCTGVGFSLTQKKNRRRVFPHQKKNRVFLASWTFSKFQVFGMFFGRFWSFFRDFDLGNITDPSLVDLTQMPDVGRPDVQTSGRPHVRTSVVRTSGRPDGGAINCWSHHFRDIIRPCEDDPPELQFGVLGLQKSI